MGLIADILMTAGSLGAAIYCIVLAGRLKRFNNLQSGMGGAVAVLSAQVDDMTRMLVQAQKAAVGSSADLSALTERAEDVARRLELMLAAMQDLPEQTESTSVSPQAPADEQAAADPAEAEAPEPATPPVFLSSRQRPMEAAQ